MTTSSYMPGTDNGKADLLDHLANTLTTPAPLLMISDEDVASLKIDALAFRYSLLTLGEIQASSQCWGADKNNLRDGGNGSGEWPFIPTLPQPIATPVSPGIILRLSALVARIKASKNHTEAIGKDLWIVVSKQIIDPTTWKPALGIKIQAGHPIILWTKGNAAAIEIWVDRGDGHFSQLAINTEPNTTDNWPLPPAGTSAMWRYKAIYLLHDEQVGQWSDVISVSVGG